MSDMEGKAARVEVSKPGGERVSIPLLCILTDHMFLLETRSSPDLLAPILITSTLLLRMELTVSAT